MRTLVAIAAAAALVAACKSEAEDSESSTESRSEPRANRAALPPGEPINAARLTPEAAAADEPDPPEEPQPMEAEEPAAAPQATPPSAATKKPATKNPAAKKPAPNAPPAGLDEDDAVAAAREQAKALFRQRCITCHGPNGDGKGQMSRSLNPKPRNWTDAAWQSDTSDATIEKVILEGGSAVGLSPLMPGNVDLEDKPAVVRELRKIVRGFGS